MNNVLRIAAIALVASACDRVSTFEPVPVGPALDGQLRASMEFWGVMPIAPLPAQNPRLVELGQALFFDKELSGNRDISCATCHDPDNSMIDALALPVGTGGSGHAASRVLGTGRAFVPRNAPTLLNQGLGFIYTLWDGRVNQEWGPSNTFRAPQGVVFPSGLTNLLAAQAMLPVLSRVEMRGTAGDRDVFGNTNELAMVADTAPAAVWRGVMTRLLAIQDYVAKFNAAYPGVPTSGLGFQHAANAIAAFQLQNFTRTNTPFDRFLHRDNTAMTDEQKRGGILFFTKAQCASCHSGALLGGNQFANIGIPQFGPGTGAAAPLDLGRAEHIGQNTGLQMYRFNFRAPALRNVELTAPYMHNGAYGTLESVVRHYTNADSALRNYDVTNLPAELRTAMHNDAATLTDISRGIDFRLRDGRIRLTVEEQKQLVAFLKSLTDPAAKNLAAVIPASVPSGLSIRD
jgi:cytochrome c peroxidase